MRKNKTIRTTLENGLTVVLREVHSAPIVSLWVWYRVGSKNETAGFTGVSHWVEHMQFKGTAKYGPGLKSGSSHPFSIPLRLAARVFNPSLSQNSTGKTAGTHAPDKKRKRNISCPGLFHDCSSSSAAAPQSSAIAPEDPTHPKSSQR